MKPPLKFLNGPAWKDTPSYPDTLFIRRFRTAAVVLALVCIGLAIIGMADSISTWLWPDRHAHARFSLPHQPLPALLCLVLAGLGVLSVQRFPHRTRWLQSALGALVIGLGFFTVNAGLPIPWNLDRLTGWIVLLLGFSIGAGGSRLSMVGYVRQFAIFVIFFLCGLIVVGYLYEVSSGKLYLSEYMRTPWITALNGLVAGHALLFQHPNFGVMRLMSGAGFGSQIMRRLLPSMIVLLVLLGWLLALGEHLGWYPPSFGQGLYAVLAIAGFSGILMFSATSLNRIDGERLERERDVRRQQQQVQAILDHTSLAICLRDLSGKYILVNQSFANVAGRKSPEECLGKTSFDFFPEAIARRTEGTFNEALRTRGAVETIEQGTLTGRVEDTMTYLSARFPLMDGEGTPYALCGIYTDITEIKRQEDEIRRLNESLREKTLRQEAANDELEAFSYSVSHDLRAPLRHIAGFGQLLAQRNRDTLDEKSRHYLNVIETSVRRMGDLIDDLLSFSRASKVELVTRPVNTTGLVAEVRADIEAGRKGPDLTWDIGPLPEMRGDPAMLRLVWVNLLSNAVKYSGKNPAPRITIRFGAVGEEPGAFSVRDNGAGFDMRYADKLFGVFQRLHSAKEYDGTGIGLAMVRRILERHGGRIWADAAPGMGACFYFVLPDSNRKAGDLGAPEKHQT